MDKEHKVIIIKKLVSRKKSKTNTRVLMDDMLVSCDMDKEHKLKLHTV